MKIRDVRVIGDALLHAYDFAALAVPNTFW